jgi:hypothetical protein
LAGYSNLAIYLDNAGFLGRLACFKSESAEPMDGDVFFEPVGILTFCFY